MKAARLRQIKNLNRAWAELTDWQDPIETMVKVIDELIREVNSLDLTKAQRHWLSQAYTLNDKDYLSFSVRSRAGGAVRRMMERMCEIGLMYGPPYRITLLGRLTYERITRDGK